MNPNIERVLWMLGVCACSFAVYNAGVTDGEDNANVLFADRDRQFIRLAAEREQAVQEVDRLQVPLRIRRLEQRVTIAALQVLVQEGEMYVAFRPDGPDSGEPLAAVIREGGEVKFLVNLANERAERIRKVNFLVPK